MVSIRERTTVAQACCGISVTVESKDYKDYKRKSRRSLVFLLRIRLVSIGFSCRDRSRRQSASCRTSFNASDFIENSL